MSKIKGFCQICGTDIEIQICCNGFDCGCMGLPVDPPVCSDECYGKYMAKIRSNKNKKKMIPFKPE